MLALLDPTHLVSTWGYAAIFVLSVLQSCCVPTSSELVMGFAGVLASEGKLSLPGAIAAGVAGEVVGAYIAYAVGRTGARALVDRYGRYILVSHHDLDRAEAWYAKHGDAAVFGGRLLPVIRNFVALPAGMAEVPPVRFGVLTFLGSAIWLTTMALIGYEVGTGWQSVMHKFTFAGYLLAAAAVIVIAFLIYHRYRAYHAAVARSTGAQSRDTRAADVTPPAPQPTGVLAPDPSSLASTATPTNRPVGGQDPPPGSLNPRGHHFREAGSNSVD